MLSRSVHFILSGPPARWVLEDESESKKILICMCTRNQLLSNDREAHTTLRYHSNWKIFRPAIAHLHCFIGSTSACLRSSTSSFLRPGEGNIFCASTTELAMLHMGCSSGVPEQSYALFDPTALGNWVQWGVSEISVSFSLAAVTSHGDSRWPAPLYVSTSWKTLFDLVSFVKLASEIKPSMKNRVWKLFSRKIVFEHHTPIWETGFEDRTRN